jgi:hypothetical protein
MRHFTRAVIISYHSRNKNNQLQNRLNDKYMANQKINDDDIDDDAQNVNNLQA